MIYSVGMKGVGMITLNLKKFVDAEPGLSINKLSALTNISRTSLTKLYDGKSTGIQFYTLDQLCKVLDLEPQELIEYSNEQDTQLASNLRDFRKIRGISQLNLSQLLHVSRQSVGAYEKGTREPNLKTLSKLAAIYRTSIDELVGRGERDD